MLGHSTHFYRCLGWAEILMQCSRQYGRCRYQPTQCSCSEQSLKIRNSIMLIGSSYFQTTVLPNCILYLCCILPAPCHEFKSFKSHTHNLFPPGILNIQTLLYSNSWSKFDLCTCHLFLQDTMQVLLDRAEAVCPSGYPVALSAAVATTSSNAATLRPPLLPCDS